ncbi:MAG: LPS assembly lipoprotein LptE [Rhodospirillales bacterium]
MWWLDARALTLAVLLSFGAGLGGCGFHPLYGGDGAREASAELAAVHISTIPDRNGQMLHNLLLDRVNPQGRPGDPRYVLDIRLTESKANLGIIKDSSSTLAQIASTASYTLRDLKANKVLQTGRSRSVTSYNIVQSDFATLAAEKDARARTLRDIAEDVATKVAVFLAGRKDG